jgi:hypothetical protein
MLSLLFGAMCGAFLSYNYMRHALIYTRLLEEGWGVHYNHLLYGPLGHLFYRVWQLLGYNGRALLPMQVLSIGVGTVGIGLFYLLNYTLIQDRTVALAASIFLAFSYGYWRYSMDAMPYIFVAFFSTCLFILALKTPYVSSKTLFVGIGVIEALLGLFHIGMVITVPAVIVLIFSVNSAFFKKMERSIIYLITFALVFGLAYSGVGFFVEKLDSIISFRHWIFGQAGIGEWAPIGSFSFMNIAKVPLGLGNTFVGEIFCQEFLAKSPYFQDVILFLATGFSQPVSGIKISNAQFLALFLLLGLVAAGFLIWLVYFVVFGKRLWRQYRTPLILCLSWIAFVGGLAAWWMPENRQQWMAVLTPMGVLFALMLKDAKESMRHRISVHKQELLLGVFLASFFSLNFFGSILLMHDPENNRTLQVARLVKDQMRKDDLAFALEAGNIRHATEYIRYFAGCEVWAVRAMFLGDQAEMEKHFASGIRSNLSAGQRVYVLYDVFDNDLGYAQISKQSGLSENQIQEDIRRFFSAYRQVPVLNYNGQPLLYELRLS